VTHPPVVSSVLSEDGTSIGYRSVGSGPSVIVVGGAMRAGLDYLRFAEVLAERFTVHVLDRRGRGASGPLGPDYQIEKECQDLHAVQRATGARLAFGHSYGGLAVLQTAARADLFDRVAVYEPAVSVDGSVPTAWMTRYRELLDHGDTRGAFACFVRAFGPPALTRLPSWYVRAVLRLVIRRRRWTERFEPLLLANLVEHDEVAALDGDLDRYRAVTARVLLLAGGRTSASGIAPLARLEQTLQFVDLDILDGLDHVAPDERRPTWLLDASSRS
jgi:pimeloyl-ACP methyl ester carboxylesterase